MTDRGSDRQTPDGDPAVGALVAAWEAARLPLDQIGEAVRELERSDVARVLVAELCELIAATLKARAELCLLQAGRVRFRAEQRAGGGQSTHA